MRWKRQLALAKMALEDIQRTDHLLYLYSFENYAASVFQDENEEMGQDLSEGHVHALERQPGACQGGPRGYAACIPAAGRRDAAAG